MAAGSLTACASVGSQFVAVGPWGIGVLGTMLFVTQMDPSNNIIVCDIAGAALSGCVVTAVGAAWTSPKGVAFSGTTAFVVSSATNSVYACAVTGSTAAAGTLSACTSILAVTNPASIYISRSMDLESGHRVHRHVLWRRHVLHDIWRDAGVMRHHH